MSAAVLPAPQLARPHAAQPPQRQAQGCTIVRGPLMHDAVFSINPGTGHAQLLVRIDLGRGKPYEASLALGDEPGRLVAMRINAAHMRQGCRVEVHASAGVRDRNDHGVAMAVLMDVTNIILLDLPARRGCDQEPQQ